MIAIQDTRAEPELEDDSDAIHAYVSEWMADELKVAEQLVEFEEDGELFAAAIAEVLTCHADDFAVKAKEFFDAMRNKVAAAFGDKAIEQVETDNLNAFDRGISE